MVFLLSLPNPRRRHHHRPSPSHSPFFLFSFLVRSSSWSLRSTRSTSATFSRRTGPLGPNFPSNGARFVPPDLAPRVAIPPDPLTDPFLPHLTSRRLRSPLFSRNDVVLRTREVTNDVAAIIHHPTPFRSANRCRGARGCVGDEGEERGAKGEEGAARVGWNSLWR
ncbi:hypothetical protein ACSQ67_016722 [Phaseolus vulgaris]